jgi:PhoH-like ATPase
MSTYVLDTSVILSAGKSAFRAFAGQEVVIPLIVISELEKKRNDPELGLTARSALRLLEELRSKGDIRQGVELDNGATIRIEVNHVDTSNLPSTIKREGGNDTKVLAVAHALSATLISRDLPLRIRAEVVGVPSRDLLSEDITEDEEDKIPVVYINDSEMNEFYNKGAIRTDEDFPRNANVMLSTHTSGATALGVVGPQWVISKVENERVMGKIEGKNARQRFALDHLLNPDVPVVSLGGKAGSGKSLLALAAGMEQVESGDYKKVVVFKTAHVISGGDLGYLPGTEEEKFSGFTASVFDAMEEFATTKQVENYIRSGRLEIRPISHLRGRTLTNSFVIFDEAQNSELSTILTVLSRAGKNSKFVLTHDIDQRDNLHVGKHQGIYEAVQRMRGNKLFAHVNLNKSERSDVAEMAASLLSDYVY